MMKNLLIGLLLFVVGLSAFFYTFQYNDGYLLKLVFYKNVQITKKSRPFLVIFPIAEEDGGIKLFRPGDSSNVVLDETIMILHSDQIENFNKITPIDVPSFPFRMFTYTIEGSLKIIYNNDSTKTINIYLPYYGSGFRDYTLEYVLVGEKLVLKNAHINQFLRAPTALFFGTILFLVIAGFIMVVYNLKKMLFKKREKLPSSTIRP